MLLRKLTVVAALSLAAMMGGGVASAAPAGNIVALGDSFTANPNQTLNQLSKLPLPAVQNYPQTDGCLQAPNNWIRKLGAKVGAPISDWSCTAQTSKTMLDRLNTAIARGDVHRGTRAVIIAVGMNDYGPFGISQGFNPLDPQKMRADYIANIRTAADKIRARAPKAKIVLSGMLAVSDPTPPNMFCTVNVIPNMPSGIPLPILQQVEVQNEDIQRAAAQAVGATFVPMRMASAKHSSCAPDLERYISGALIDTTTPNYNMAFHPSDKGSEFMASRLAKVL